MIAAAFAVSLWSQSRGLPVRSSVADYPAHAEEKGLTVAAEPVPADMVKGYFSTDLSQYAVFEVAVWPRSDGSSLDLSTLDFGLRLDGRLVRPAEPSSIAGINQRRGNARRDDIRLYPSVGMTTGSWGTGTMVGVGVGMGGRPPGPASTDADRRTMEMELGERALQDGVITKPAAGYLFFPLGKRRVGTYEMEYHAPDGTQVRLTMAAPKTK